MCDVTLASLEERVFAHARKRKRLTIVSDRQPSVWQRNKFSEFVRSALNHPDAASKPGAVGDQVCAHAGTGAQVCAHAGTGAQVHAHVGTSTQMYVHVGTSTQVYVHVGTSAHLYAHVAACAYICTESSTNVAHAKCVCVCVRVCVRVCKCECF